MKVLSLKAENFKKLVAVDISPDSHTVILSGKNAQGKSAILESMWAALSGRYASSINKPIREGEDKACVTLITDKYIITRKFTGAGSYLTVTNAEGASFKSPQSLLDAMIGDLTFDPFAFTRYDGKKQVETLLGLVDLSIDPREIDAEIKAAYDERTEIGRRGKTATGHLESLPVPAADTPNEEVSASAVLAEIDEAQAVIRANQEHKDRVAALERSIETLASNIQAYRDDIAELERSIAAMEKEREALKVELDHATGPMRPADPDITALKNKLASVEDTNRNVRSLAEYRKAKAAVDAARADYAQKTATIKGLEQKKSDALAAAKFPVEGLSFDESGVTFNGLPLSQASSAEQLKVSLGIAMALNPELRVIHIADGSLLDSESMAYIEQVAEANDYQVWIERVDESGKVGIVIEDGQVKAVNAA